MFNEKLTRNYIKRHFNKLHIPIKYIYNMYVFMVFMGYFTIVFSIAGLIFIVVFV